MVRVGTHALTATRKATLVGRLRQHRSHLADRDPGGGNHRASVFRRHVGAALIHRDGHSPALLASWLDRHGPHPGWASQETGIERSVSRNIGSMPVPRLAVPRPRHPRARRAEQHRANLSADSQDPHRRGWLGHHAIPGQIRQSELWNVEHVTHPATPTS